MTGPSSTDDRLLAQLDDHVQATTGDVWKLTRETFDHRVASPVEPCHLCGRKVFLLLPKGETKPVWLQLGDVVGQDTLFPTVQTRRHKCGDGESWSVEAALFLETALAEWALQA